MFLKIFLAAITVCSLLGCLGANRRDNKRIAAVVAIVALILFTVATLAESSIKAKEAQAAAVKKEATITGKGDAWGTITIKDDTGETREFISLYGEVLDYPQQASIDKKGTEYYKFNLAVQRESGIIDILPIVVEEDTAAYNALADIDEKGEVVGAQLLITGEIRTRNIKDKLDISVRAFSIQEDDDYKGITNQVVITGFLCKEVPIRETPRGLLIADLLLAVHREDGSQLSDYIPSIMWNGTATRATEKLHVGDCIEAVGRLQSREYIKDLGDRGKEPRTCYELSVNQYELQKKKETA